MIAKQEGERLVKKKEEGCTSRRVLEEGLPARTDVPRPRLTDTNRIFLKRRILSEEEEEEGDVSGWRRDAAPRKCGFEALSVSLTLVL